MSLQRLLLALVITVGLISPAGGQLSTTATISGTVADSSGASVPGAGVVILNLETHARNDIQSDDAGVFTVPGLPVGTYNVTVTKTGFQKFAITNLVLHPAEVASVRAALTPGELGTTIEVSADAAQIQTATAEVAHSVNAAQVDTLPLNGRNFQALAALMPGVINTSAGSGLGTGGRSTNNVLSINGLSQSTTFYALDGIWNENTGNMNQNTIVPNPDTLEEVRVLQNNYSPRYSLMGASVVLLQTRSGTNDFHGTAFEYLRNDDLNSRNFFSPSVLPYKQNIFGYNVGGPVWVPKVYNGRQKTFFFWSQQWVKLHQGLSALRGATPTADQRAGIFTSAIKDPSTGQPYPQTSPGVYQIPASQINPSALALINALYPLPNNPGGGFTNYTNLTPQITNQLDNQIKIDHNFSERFRLTGNLFHEGQTFAQNSLNSSNGGSVFPTNSETDITRNWLAQVSFTQVWTSTIVNTTSIGTNIFNLDLNLVGTSFVDQVPGYKAVLPFSGSLSNRLPLLSLSQGWSNEGIAAARPLTHAADLDDTFSDDVSYLRGKHFFQAGINVVFNTKRQNVAALSNGQWTFNGNFTGNAMADFLIGSPSAFAQQSTERRPYVHGTIISPYFEDRYRVTRNLTLTLGTRISHMPLPSPQPGFLTLFDPARYDPSKAPIVNSNGTLTTGPNYDPLNGLILNGANGVPQNFNSNHNWYFSPMVGIAWDVFGDGRTAVRGGYGLTYTRIFTNQDCSFSCATNPPAIQSVNLNNPKFPNPAGTGTAAPVTAPTLTTADTNIQATQVHSYSLSLEHQFGHEWTMSVAGAAAGARHLTGTWNLNAPKPGNGFDFNPAINSGSTFTYVFAPYTGYAAINDLTSGINQNWDALEVSVRHPAGKNLFFSANYTWSHNLVDAVVNNWNQRAYYGNSGLNTPHVFTANVIYTLPALTGSNYLTRAALGGWKYSDITTVRSGLSLTPGLSVSQQGLGARPDVVAGQSLSGAKTVAQWFNTGAFVRPAAGFYGNAGTGIIRGPGLINFDMALYKQFTVRERANFELRAEFFNVLNHTNFTSVSTSLGAGNFGQVTAAADPRIIEVALRFHF